MAKTDDKKNRIDKDLVTEAFKALSNKNRLQIFEQIRMGCGRGKLTSGERPAICEVASAVDLVPSTISHHVKELRRARLISCERRGQTIL